METKTAPQAAVNGLNYKSNVLDVNKKLKEEARTFGYSVKQLIAFAPIIGLDKTMLKNLQLINKDQDVYKQASLDVRKTKSGNYSAFYLLQYLYKISK